MQRAAGRRGGQAEGARAWERCMHRQHEQESLSSLRGGEGCLAAAAAERPGVLASPIAHQRVGGKCGRVVWTRQGEPHFRRHLTRGLGTMARGADAGSGVVAGAGGRAVGSQGRSIPVAGVCATAGCAQARMDATNTMPSLPRCIRLQPRPVRRGVPAGRITTPQGMRGAQRRSITRGGE